LLNITIKSLGAIAKAGTTRIEGVVEYAERPNREG
jgi:altronate hydrolase